MFAKVGKVITALSFLVGVLESMVELLIFFNDKDSGYHLEDIEDTVTDILLIIYDVIEEYTDINLPVSKEGVEAFVTKTIKVVEQLLDILNVFG